MTNKIFAEVYKRELETLQKEIAAFATEDDLWVIKGEIKNPAGNLALHLIGNLNHFIGAGMKSSAYIRNREEEFARKNIAREKILSDIDQLLSWLPAFLESVNEKFLMEECKVEFAGKTHNNTYMLIHLLAHLNYHIGQINYLRRMM